MQITKEFLIEKNAADVTYAANAAYAAYVAAANAAHAAANAAANAADVTYAANAAYAADVTYAADAKNNCNHHEPANKIKGPCKYLSYGLVETGRKWKLYRDETFEKISSRKKWWLEVITAYENPTKSKEIG